MSDKSDMKNAVVALMQAWPARDGWLTENQLVEALRGGGHHVRRSEEGVHRFRDYRLKTLLSEARRAGWLFRDRRVTPETFKLTRSGRATGEHQ